MSQLLQSNALRPANDTPSISIPGGENWKALLAQWNATEKTYPPFRNLTELFEAGVRGANALCAVEWPLPDGTKGQLTYGELSQRANQVARFLQKRGVKANTVVGVCAHRSIEMVIAVLGIIKAGAAYAAFDPNYPKDRLVFMIEDTQAPIILTQNALRASLPTTSAQLICLDSDWPTIAAESDAAPTCPAGPDDLAYLIYTSGSTGKPKGVAMRHEPLVNLMQWQLENWSWPGRLRTLQFASLNFDVSFQEIFSTWCSQGTLVLIDDEQRRDSNALIRFIAEQKVGRIFLPFVALKHLADAAEREECYPRCLKEVITAGEQLQITPQLVTLFSRLPECTLENQYGPSETHVVSAYRLQGPPGTWPALPSIGKPIANTKLYILDDQKQPLPPGEPGELYIGGVCLARGYLNREEMTAQKFLPDPFSKWSAARLYKTGDLARFLPDGNIEFLGRIDHQVKIRGHRVELGEVEAVLCQHPTVREAVAMAREHEGDRELVAYVVPKGDAPRPGQWREFLKERLPAQAIPARFVILDKLPLTPNGKVDRKALPDVPETEAQIEGGGKQPRTPLEMQLQLVFEKFLRKRNIGIDVSFFELGGDSLQALKLIVEIEQATGKKLPMNVLFQAPTVEALAQHITTAVEGAQYSCLVPLQRKGTHPPLYWIHTTPGDVLGYGNLIYHLPDQPAFGLQSLGLHKPELCHVRVEEMAAHYLGLIREQQPKGPYFLGGWCYGGIVAVEMAQQLRAAGETVAPLLLIETPAPAPPLSNLRYYRHRLSCLAGMKPQEWQSYLRAKIRYYRGVKGEDERRFRRVSADEGIAPEDIAAKNKALAHLERVYHTNLDALKHYRSRFYPGKVILFNAAEQDPAVIRDPLYGWPGLAGEIETHVIPGNHDTILMEPHVQVLASRMTECLRKIRSAMKVA